MYGWSIFFLYHLIFPCICWMNCCSQCNKVIQLGLVTSMPSQFLLEWYKFNPLLTLEVLVAFLTKMHMEFDWLKLDPGPWGVIWSSIFSECHASWFSAEIYFGNLVFILGTIYFIQICLSFGISTSLFFSFSFIFFICGRGCWRPG